MNISVKGGTYLDLVAVYHEALEEFIVKQEATENLNLKITLNSITIENYRDGGKRNFLCHFTADLLNVEGKIVTLPINNKMDVESSTDTSPVV